MNLRNLLILLALYSGARSGKLCALKGSDIDFINNTISINKSVQRIRNIDNLSYKIQVIVEGQKPDNSIRIVPIPRFIVILLK